MSVAYEKWQSNALARITPSQRQRAAQDFLAALPGVPDDIPGSRQLIPQSCGSMGSTLHATAIAVPLGQKHIDGQDQVHGQIQAKDAELQLLRAEHSLQLMKTADLQLEVNEYIHLQRMHVALQNQHAVQSKQFHMVQMQASHHEHQLACSSRDVDLLKDECEKHKGELKDECEKHKREVAQNSRALAATMDMHENAVAKLEAQLKKQNEEIAQMRIPYDALEAEAAKVMQLHLEHDQAQAESLKYQQQATSLAELHQEKTISLYWKDEEELTTLRRRQATLEHECQSLKQASMEDERIDLKEKNKGLAVQATVISNLHSECLELRQQVEKHKGNPRVDYDEHSKLKSRYEALLQKTHADWREETRIFSELRAAHSQKNRDHFNTTEELKALHAEHHDHKELSAAELKRQSAEYEEEAKIFAELKAGYCAMSKDHWTLSDELKAVHNEYLEYKGQSDAKYKDEAKLLDEIFRDQIYRAKYGDKSSGDGTLEEELKALHTEHHDHKALSAAELKKQAAECRDEAKIIAELKAEYGAKSKDHWTLSEELKEHKEKSDAEYKDEARIFAELRAEHGDKSSEHWTLAEELKALHAEHHDHKELSAAEWREEAKIFAELKAEHGAKSKDHWTLSEELKAVHNEYLEHKEKSDAEYKDEARIFFELRVEHGYKPSEHWTLAEELKAMHAEHHDHKELSAAEWKEEAKIFAELKAEHGAKSKDRWTLSEELKAVHSEYLEHKEKSDEENKIFANLKAEHDAKSKDHGALSEEFSALHSEYAAHTRELNFTEKVPPVKLMVTILSGRNLRNADLTGKSDPYVVIQMSEQKVRTATVDNNNNPQWNDGPHEVIYQPRLEFWVYDEDVGKGDDFLGKALLDREKFIVQGFEGELPLVDRVGKPAQGYIKVKVAIE